MTSTVGTSDGAFRMRRLVAFDMDDTLYLERDYVRSGFAAVGEWKRRELGVQDLGDRAWAAFEAGVRGRIFDEVLDACGVRDDASVVPRLVDVYRSRAGHRVARRRARVAGGSADRRGPRRGHRRPLASQRAKAAALGLAGPTPSSTPRRWGPAGATAPGGLRGVEAATGLAAAACAYVADNPGKDFTGRGRGWRTVRVRRAGSLHAGTGSGDDVGAEITGFEALDGALDGWA